ncbi:hypothetical protein [Leeuwenhoekiella sp. ZYFB001]|uniref:hypothetical protein n=1 Tax=Leeuwenhoekiella sp. ZYFB001 TaxID=2719912 RepID=UPI0014314933|nr:hypothetical protein [Leeuwenhoekiella sp. ZYFB001]
MSAKKITFINQNEPWRLAVPSVGFVLFLVGMLALKETALGTVIQPLGMLLMFVPHFIPFKLKNYVRFTRRMISFKLEKGGSYHYRFSQIKYVEAYEDRLVIYTSKKKSEKVRIEGYAKADINRLLDLLQPETEHTSETV